MMTPRKRLKVGTRRLPQNVSSYRRERVRERREIAAALSDHFDFLDDMEAVERFESEALYDCGYVGNVGVFARGVFLGLEHGDMRDEFDMRSEFDSRGEFDSDRFDSDRFDTWSTPRVEADYAYRSMFDDLLDAESDVCDTDGIFERFDRAS